MSDNKQFGSKQYLRSSLTKKDLNINPFKQFDDWYKLILELDIEYPNAMVLSTSNHDSYPSSRVVLLKGFDESGFSFYTNSKSEKGKNMDENPFASICFWWPDFERQVRINGDIKLLPDEIIDEYFDSRPRGSKIAASISKQSEVVESREYLEKLYEGFDLEYSDKTINRPDVWKGYILIPKSFEFWQGRENRLHDRFKYSLTGNKSWKIERLYP